MNPLLNLPLAGSADPLDPEHLIAELRAARQTPDALLGDAPPALHPIADAVLAACIRDHLASRRARDRIIGPGWFADPVWDVLLDLLACQLEGRVVSISSACIAASVPTSTALRCIDKLVAAGALHRAVDPEDRRRSLVALDPDMAAKVRHWVVQFLLRQPEDGDRRAPPLTILNT